MSKILKDIDTVNLIKAGCNKVYADNMNEITVAKDTLHKLQQDVADLYNLPLDIEKYFAMQRTGKLYQVKIPKYSYNTSPACIKTLDNAGLTCIPSTNTTTNTNDYLTIPLFKWYNCNYIRNQYGEPIITYKEGDTGYVTTGAVDVGCFGMSFYWSWLDGNNYSNLDNNYYYLTISDKPNADWYLQPWEGCVRHDGTVAPYWCYSKYFVGQGSDGELRSQPNLLPVCWMSHDRMLNSGALNENGLNAHSGGFQHKGQGYWGAGVDRHLFGYIFTMIKYATKSNQTVMAGCTNYYLKYSCAYPDSNNHDYIILNTGDASNLEIGSTVIVGYNYKGSASGEAFTRGDDRGDPRMRAYLRDVVIKSKENITLNSTTYTKVTLMNIDGTPVSFNTAEVMIDSNSNITTDASQAIEFTTADVNVSDSSNHKLCTIKICTTPWKSGTTDSIAGMNDGSMGNNGSASGGNINGGHFPFRVQGLEYSIGAWTVCGDTVMRINSDYSTDFYVAQKGIPHTNNASIIAASDNDTYNGQRYIKTGTMDKDVGGTTSFYSGEILIPSISSKTTTYNSINYTSSTLTFYPGSRGAGNSVGTGDYCYRSASTGWREFLIGGYLAGGGYAGFACLHCYFGLSDADWSVTAAD